ncbi:hypothetical protein BS78_02G026200 [Paspalum vaginatum]|nr:hypothetical protein BS78_02G026200 [Paspalum vaginatum]
MSRVGSAQPQEARVCEKKTRLDIHTRHPVSFAPLSYTLRPQPPCRRSAPLRRGGTPLRPRRFALGLPTARMHAARSVAPRWIWRPQSRGEGDGESRGRVGRRWQGERGCTCSEPRPVAEGRWTSGASHPRALDRDETEPGGGGIVAGRGRAEAGARDGAGAAWQAADGRGTASEECGAAPPLC